MSVSSLNSGGAAPELHQLNSGGRQLNTLQFRSNVGFYFNL